METVLSKWSWAVCLLSSRKRGQNYRLSAFLTFSSLHLNSHFTSLKKEVKDRELKSAGFLHASITRICHGAIHKKSPWSISLLQSPKETALISARALAAKSKHSPAHSTCFLITAWSNKWFLMKVKELMPWVTVHHLQLHPFPPRKAWQALAGDLKTSWLFETYSAYRAAGI